jgi:hypothetical protein
VETITASLFLVFSGEFVRFIEIVVPPLFIERLIVVHPVSHRSRHFVREIVIYLDVVRQSLP